MNSEPLSESMAIRSNGRLKRTSSSAATMPISPLPITARVSVQPVQISVMLNEQIKSPDALGPQCTTRSISKYPGVVTSQLSVLMGIWLLSNLPGLVWPYRRFLLRCLLPANRRSICLGLILSSACSTSGVSPRYVKTRPGNPARHHGLQTKRPRTSRILPYRLQRSAHCGTVAGTTTTTRHRPLGFVHRVPKQCDRVLAVIARQGHKLIQQL